MSPFSLAVAKIELLYAGTTLAENAPAMLGGVGTGFFYNAGGTVAFVTNWHNVTGLDAVSLKPLHSQGLLPDTVRIYYKRWIDPATKMISSRCVELSLYRQNEPIWYEHPARNTVDVVVIPLDVAKLEAFANICINDIKQEPRLKVEAGMDCFILGFPEGLVGAGNTPIWKRGMIASEPQGNQPYHVDAAARKGMSGAPVIAQHNGLFTPKAGHLTSDSVIGSVQKFVAVYSGRVGDDALGFQLGTACRAEVIEEILAAKLPGRHPVDFPRRGEVLSVATALAEAAGG
jgi:hypothetical protein